jgi:fructan beta-fructosidase
MRVLAFISIFLIIGLSIQASNSNGVTYQYDSSKKCVTVTIPASGCSYLYITIDESTAPIRVARSVEPQIWNDIRLQRSDSTYNKLYEIGIWTNSSTELIFNFTPEFSSSENLSRYNENFESWPSFESMHCNDVNNYEYVATNDKETKYRPGYHHTPYIGWMNDPNGLVYEDIANEGKGYYHLFYQYNPYSSWWDNMHWGHSKSKNLLNWSHRPPALFRFEKGHIFSGSVCYNPDDSKLYAFFTVWRKYEYKGTIYEFQHNYVATSDSDTDTYNILEYSGELGRFGKQYNNVPNPILIPEEEREFYEENPKKGFDDYIVSEKFYNNYRDPKIVKYSDDTNSTSYFVLLISADIEYRIYQNKDSNGKRLTDLLTWSLVGRFGLDYGVDKRYMQYECPDIARIFPSGSSHAKWVFIANINPGGPFGGSATEYFTGDFDGATYTSDHVFPKWMDFGKDHYATVTYTNIPDEERVLALPWTSNWIYAKIVPTFQYRSTNGLPREFTLFKVNGEYFLNVAPSREVESLLRTTTYYQIDAVVSKKQKKKTDTIVSGVAGDGMYELNIDVTVTGKPKKYGFTLSNDDGEKVDFFFDTKKDKLWNEYGLGGSGSFIMDRRYSGDQNFLAYGERGWGTHGREKKLSSSVYAYTKNCYKYVDPFKLGTKIPMALLKSQKKHNVQIFYDKSHIEVFLDGGRAVMTNVVFPNGKYYNNLKFYTDKGTVTFSGRAYKLQVPATPETTA